MEAASDNAIDNVAFERVATRWAWAVAILAILFWSGFVFASASYSAMIGETAAENHTLAVPLITIYFMKWGRFCQGMGLVLVLLPMILAWLLRDRASDPHLRKGWLISWGILLSVVAVGTGLFLFCELFPTLDAMSQT